jgi:hypothetical protein
MDSADDEQNHLPSVPVRAKDDSASAGEPTADEGNEPTAEKDEGTVPDAIADETDETDESVEVSA